MSPFWFAMSIARCMRGDSTEVPDICHTAARRGVRPDDNSGDSGEESNESPEIFAAVIRGDLTRIQISRIAISEPSMTDR